ncbi:MAG: porin family protein [Burkholderiales bacterium]
MNFTKTLAATVLIGAGLMTAPAMAAGPWYGGLNIGQFKANDCSGDCSDTAYKLLAGYQFTPNVGVEVAYMDGGKIGGVKPTAFGVGVVGTFPVGNGFSLLGRLAVNNAKAKPDVGSSESSTELGFGLGAAYAISPAVDLSLEFERVKFKGGDGDLVSLGAKMKF